MINVRDTFPAIHDFRKERFVRLLDAIGKPDARFADELARKYSEIRSKSYLPMRDALHVLEKLSKRFTLGVITNGVRDEQRRVISTLGFDRFMTHIVVSGEVGYKKPQKEIFGIAREMAGKPVEQIAYLDDLPENTKAALDEGFMAMFFDPRYKHSDQVVKASAISRITSLSQFFYILEM